MKVSSLMLNGYGNWYKEFGNAVIVPARATFGTARFLSRNAA